MVILVTYWYQLSVKATMPLVEKIVSYTATTVDLNVHSAQQAARSESEKALKNSVDHIKNTVPRKVSRSLDLAGEKEHPFGCRWRRWKKWVLTWTRGSLETLSSYDWSIDDTPRTCVCGETFSVDHAIIYKREGFVIQRHNELCDIEAELLCMVCNDVQTEPVWTSGEQLSRGKNWTFMHVDYGKDDATICLFWC